MKSIIAVLILLLIIVTISHSQVQIQWQKCLGDTSSEGPYSLVQTTDGGYVVAGISYSNICGNHGNGDVWVVKIDSAGNTEWQKCYGGTDLEYAKSIIQTTDDGYAIAGYTRSNDGDVGGLHDTSGSSDFWVIKLDAAGSLEWQKCLGGSSWDWAESIIQTSEGGYAVAGVTGSFDGDITFTYGGDFWIVKLDIDGNIQWQKCLGGTNWDFLHSMIYTPDGGYALAGSSESNDGDVTGNHGFTDFWVIKLDSLSNIQWQKCFGGTNSDCAWSIINTNDGGYAMTGSTISNDGDVTGNNGDTDIWVVKMDAAGNMQWQKCLGGTDYDNAMSMIQISGGEYMIGGIAISNDNDVSGNHGSRDIWVVKLDSIGNIIWQKCFGGTNEEYALSIIQTSDGCYAVAGYTESNNWDVSGNHGGGDFWVMKLFEPNISGLVYNDENFNGQLDTGEQGAANQMLKLEPGPYFTFSNDGGKYYFSADNGNYTVSYIPFNYWFSTTAGYYNITVDSIGHEIDTLDFGIVSHLIVNDVAVYIMASPVVVNDMAHYWLIYKNWGTVTTSGTVNFQFDPLLTFDTASVTPVSQTGNLLVFDYDTLGPGVQRFIRADFLTPGVQYLGDTIQGHAWVTPLTPDTNIINNYDTIEQVIVGSYDPNDKHVTPAGIGTEGIVQHGTRLSYTIRFQNTGNDTAHTIIIRDTIDTDLNFGTFLLEANSHPVELSVNNGNELVFRFQNIMLPDSNTNEPESHGFVQYSISPKTSLADGTTAKNTAYIFFDFNPAIVTNTVQNTFASMSGKKGVAERSQKNFAYPNPAREVVYINLPEFTRRVEVYDTEGRMQLSYVPDRVVAAIRTKDLAPGMYLVRIYSNSGMISTKFIKE